MNNNMLLLYLFGMSVYCITSIVAREAIINGHKAAESQFPYQVSLMNIYHENACGGGIIEQQFIITAAHCVTNFNGQFHGARMFVLAGTHDLLETRKPAVKIEVTKIYVPMAFKSEKTADIAVLKLNHSLELWRGKYFKRLHLPTNISENHVDKIATVAGFGWDYIHVVNNIENGNNSDSCLRFTHVDIVSLDQFDPKIGEEIICAKTSTRTQPREMFNMTKFRHGGVCNGDSGSPLVYNNTVIGILSTSPVGCVDKDSIGATYTRVSRYLHFIDKAIHDKDDKDLLVLDMYPS